MDEKTTLLSLGYGSVADVIVGCLNRGVDVRRVRRKRHQRRCAAIFTNFAVFTAFFVTNFAVSVEKAPAIHHRNLEIYNGAFYESLVASDLARLELPLFYYKQSETLELDFVLRIKNEIVPIEVKRSRGRAASLGIILSKSLPHIKTGIKLTHRNIGYENNLLAIPYFLTFLFRTLIDDNPLFSW